MKTKKLSVKAFERISISFLAVMNGVMLIYLSVQGPLLLDQIHYKTSASSLFQIMGQDIVNLFIISSVLFIAGIGLFLKKNWAKYLLVLTPVYLMYYALSYGLGVEWSMVQYKGNSEQYFFHFLFILISSLIFLMYSVSIFPAQYHLKLKKRGLITYSFVFIVFLVLFAAMWMRQVIEIIYTGTTAGYAEAPTVFWVIRYFDLGFTIPLGFLSVYFLWTRPDETYTIQLLFYGFFLTMIAAVNSMGIFMFFNNDPNFSVATMSLFGTIAVIVFSGYYFIRMHYHKNI